MTEKLATKTVKVKEPLSRLGGSKSDDWNLTLADQACQMLWTKNSSAETRDRQIEGVVAALIGINPGDEIEGMIAAQMIACHSAAMECYRRAMLPEQTFEGRNMGVNHGAKASRTYAALVEALSRHRGKGQQKMTVEHVHVHQGGQAIVGMVGRGGRQSQGSEEQPHAKQIADAHVSPMCGQVETEREALPVTSGARS